jgi:hypothetical protein
MSNPDSGWRKHEKEKRTLDIVNIKDGKNKINDLEVVGNGDMLKLRFAGRKTSTKSADTDLIAENDAV